MKSVRSIEQNNKISKEEVKSRGCSSEQFPWISFKSMTKNSKYNLSKLKDGKEREQTLLGVYSRLLELSMQPWLYWNGMRKKTGLETLYYEDLNFDANATLSKDTTIYVFRFDSYHGSGRILGYKTSPCAVFHIIGYDLDFSAYNHG